MDFPNENKNLEYKKAKNEVPKDFWKTYSAFANAEGGRVVLGIEEKQGKTLEITGVSDEEKIIKTIFDTLNSDKVSLNLLADKDMKVKIIEKSKKIIIIDIPEASYSSKPVHLNGDLKQSYIRRHEGNYRCTDDELRTMIRNSKDILDDKVLLGYSIDDIDMETLESYRKRVDKLKSDHFYKDKSDQEFLISLGAMKKNRDNGEYELTLGGLLFFGKYSSIREELPHYHLEYFNRINTGANRWSDRVATGDLNYPNLNLYQFFIVTLEKLKLTLNLAFELDEELIRSNNNDIGIALREALANAIIHADYLHDLPVKIIAYHDYYDFENPGKMRVSVEEFAMGGNSRPRNHIIELLFRTIGFCERAGSGGQKIFQTAITKDYKIPDIEQFDNSTLLRFWKINFIDSFPELEDAAKEIIIVLKNEKVTTTKEIMEVTTFRKTKVLSLLNDLIDKKIVQKIGQGRSTKYRITETKTETIANLEHKIRQLQKHLTL